MKLSRKVKARINKQAHAAGVAYAEKVRLRLLEEFAAQGYDLTALDEAFGDLPTFDTAGLLDMDELLALCQH